MPDPSLSHVSICLSLAWPHFNAYGVLNIYTSSGRPYQIKQTSVASLHSSGMVSKCQESENFCWIYHASQDDSKT